MVGASSADKPLGGVLVVALEQAVAAPFCTSRLADAGARVIKVERLDGDFCRHYDDVAKGNSAYFVWLNRGKESVCLDLKTEADLELLERIIAKADVFVQNLAPGAASRLGLGSADLRGKYPGLITVDISGYGEEGPYRDMKAYDLLLQSETGLASITGSPESPGRVGVSLGDIACGMYAHSAVLQALLRRYQTGAGDSIKVSLFDSLADWMTVPLLHQDYSGIAPERVGINHPSIAPYGAYACRGGDRIVVSIQHQREWNAFCRDVLQKAEMGFDERFVDNHQRCQHRDALDLQINLCFGVLSRDEVVERLDMAKIAYGRINTVAQFSQHPQLRRMPIETPTGVVEIVSPPVLNDNSMLDRSAPEVRVPALGEHTEFVRKEFQQAL